MPWYCPRVDLPRSVAGLVEGCRSDAKARSGHAWGRRFGSGYLARYTLLRCEIGPKGSTRRRLTEHGFGWSGIWASS